MPPELLCLQHRQCKRARAWHPTEARRNNLQPIRARDDTPRPIQIPPAPATYAATFPAEFLSPRPIRAHPDAIVFALFGARVRAPVAYAARGAAQRCPTASE